MTVMGAFIVNGRPFLVHIRSSDIAEAGKAASAMGRRFTKGYFGFLLLFATWYDGKLSDALYFSSFHGSF